MWFFTLLLVSFCAATHQKCQGSQHCSENGDLTAERFVHPKNLAGKSADCPPGFTGADCKNAICYSASTMHFHDGTKDLGEDIMSAFSQSPNSTFQIPVDKFVNDLYVSIDGPSSREGTLTDPKGNVVIPCMITTTGSPQQAYPVYTWLAKYCGIAMNNPAGMYSFTATTNNPWFFVYASGTTSLVVDGGFVSDQRDDNVQERPPAGHDAVERNPISGVPSYFAFALGAQATATSVDIVSYVGITAVTTTYAVNKRYNCGADNIMGRSLTCTAPSYGDGQYDMRVTGTDDQGNFWQRKYSFRCPAASHQQKAGDRSTQCICRKGCKCSDEEAAKQLQDQRKRFEMQQQ